MAVDAFAREVMADGPIGYWRLGEVVGSAVATDSSGNGNNGVCSGPITFGQSGLFGGDTSALFSSPTVTPPTPRIVVLNSYSLNPSTITMEAKIRWDGPNPVEQQRIIEKSSFQGLAQYGLSVYRGHARVEIRTSSATTSVLLDGGTPIGRGVESHIVATYDGKDITLYINGELDASTDAPGSVSPKPPLPPNMVESGVGIGNETERDRPFNGLIDEVALYPSALSAERVRAHYRAQFGPPVSYQYAVKFVCGSSDGSVVAPGVYFTAINVHNPLYRSIRFRVKVAIALPGLQPGPVSPFHTSGLEPDEALEIDCPDIFKLARHDRDFLKGFVVIESRTELDVVAVYTASGQEGTVETLHMERVAARQTPVTVGHECIDFEPPLAVGTQFGTPVGQSSGDAVLTSTGIAVALADFDTGHGTAFGLASIDNAPPALGGGQVLRLNNIALDIDFSGLPFPVHEVSFDFLDRGGLDNLGVNGVPPPLIGNLTSAPPTIAGLNVAVTAGPVGPGSATRGRVVLSGAVEILRIGGQELWIDNVCAKS